MNITFASTLDVLGSVKTHLAAMPFPGATDGEKLFQLVDFAIDKNITAAVQQLYAFKDRIALIIPTGDDFELKSSSGVNQASVVRTVTCDVLIADRDFLGGRAAAFGGPNQIGALAMKDLVIARLATCGMRPIPIPVEANVVEISAEQKDSPGRQCWVVAYRFFAGEGNITAASGRF